MPIRTVKCNVCGKEVTWRQSQKNGSGRCCREHTNVLDENKSIRLEKLKACIMAYFSGEVSERSPGGRFYNWPGVRSLNDFCIQSFDMVVKGCFYKTNMAAILREVYLSNRTYDEGRELFKKDLLAFGNKYNKEICLHKEDSFLCEEWERPTLLNAAFHYGCDLLFSQEDEYLQRGDIILDLLKRYSDQFEPTE